MIPATALGGALLTDWLPVCWPNSHAPGGYQDGVLLPGRVIAWLMSDGLTVDSSKRLDGLLLDPTRPEAAHRIADALRPLGHEVGHLLPVELGGRVGDAREYREDPENGMGVSLFAVRAARVSARLLAASVEGVEQGRGVVRRLYSEVNPRTGRRRLLIAEPGCTWETDDFEPSDPTRDAYLDPAAPDGVRVPGEVDG